MTCKIIKDTLAFSGISNFLYYPLEKNLSEFFLVLPHFSDSVHIVLFKNTKCVHIPTGLNQNLILATFRTWLWTMGSCEDV